METKKRTNLFVFLVTFTVISILLAAAPVLALSPPTGLTAVDTPSDNGSTVLLTWPSGDGYADGMEYIIYSSLSENGEFKEIGRFPANENFLTDNPHLMGYFKTEKDIHFYKAAPEWETIIKEIYIGKEKREIKRKGDPKQTYFKVGLTDGATIAMGTEVVTAMPKKNLFKWELIYHLYVMLFMIFAVIILTNMAKRNPNMFLRKIPGIDAIDEAVGRATEMGKPILYSTGYSDIDKVSTICSVNILGHVAKKVAQYESRLIVPCKWPVAMTVCQEVVKESYINAGRPDAFNINDISFIAGEQFSYTAGVDGLMVREKPAANLFLGTFAAEALILAETGAATGAIQIAGTDSSYQIPFFVVACDYCLIAEELYAASAYLSHDPKLIGTLKAQDSGKVVLFFSIIIGIILLTIVSYNTDTISESTKLWFSYIKHIFTSY
jgi:uncharacterized protein DUF6754